MADLATLVKPKTKRAFSKAPLPYFIAVAGGTGSGKTYVAKELQRIDSQRISVIGHDNYYKDRSDVPLKDRKKLNYDEPKALDNDLFVAHLKAWKKGESVFIPQYDFSTHTRKKETREVKPTPIMIFDGILILSIPEIEKMFDLKIFIEVEADIRMARRIIRDVGERDRTFEESINQYLTSAQPMYDKYVEPGKDKADLTINNNGTEEELNTALQVVKARIKEILKK